MATSGTRVVLRNPPAEAVLARLYGDITAITKGAAKDILAKHQPEIRKPQVFAWKGNGRARKFASIDAIPVNILGRPPATIGIVDANKGSIIANVAVAAVARWARLAPVRTGVLAGSLVLELNGRPRSLSTIVKIGKVAMFSEKEEIWIYPAALYAASVEAAAYKRDGDGIVLKVTRELIAQFGSTASIQFAYVRGRGNYALPAIRIGGAGQFMSGVKRSLPGYRMRRRKREAAKRKAKAS